MTEGTLPVDAVIEESYIVSEGKKRGSTREVHAASAYDQYVKVLRVRADDSLLTDNWHTNEVHSHAKANFEGHTFAVRTLEAWGAVVESDDRASYTAGGRVWILDLGPGEAKKPKPAPGA
jgi:hypothetical protein